MQAIHDPSVDHENKGIAWDNFEQLVENLDNANNMEALKLWTPLVEKLESEDTQDREMACWCLGTAVQNNIKCQERVSTNPVLSLCALGRHADFDDYRH